MLSTLLLLSLPSAEAAKIKNVRVVASTTSGSTTYKVINISGGTDTNLIEHTVTSDAGTETVLAVETNAWLHGVTSLSSLPKTNATVQLSVYDSSNNLLTSLSGSFSPDGTVLFSTPSAELDLSVLSASLFPATSGGYEMSLHLEGVDSYAAVYADLTVTEAKTSVCDKSGCYTVPGSITQSEVFWDDVGAVWEAALAMAPVGAVEVETTAYDARGKKLESADVVVSGSFFEDGAGRMAVALNENTPTSVAVDNPIFQPSGGTLSNVLGRLSVVSDGWNNTTAPTTATIALKNGSTITLPASSYQMLATQSLSSSFNSYANGKEKPSVALTISGGSILLNGSSTVPLSDLSSPICVKGGCISLRSNTKGSYEASVSAYASTASALPNDTTVTLTLVDASGNKLYSEKVFVSYDGVVAVFFENEVEYPVDPFGLDLSGELSLLSPPDKKGKQKTALKGMFYGQFSVSEYGELGLAGADKNEVVPRGDILIGGEPIGFELTDTNGDGVVTGPPDVIWASNGKGTRDVTTINTGKPGLL